MRTACSRSAVLWAALALATPARAAEPAADRAAVAVDNARLYTELSGIADTLQAELLPTEIPDIPGIDVAVRYRAAGLMTPNAKKLIHRQAPLPHPKEPLAVFR